MKVTVRIKDRAFEVEIENLFNRPIIAIVEGERFEIWPEETVPAVSGSLLPAARSTGSHPVVKLPSPSPGKSGGSSTTNVIRAPIPGVIISIAVQEGDQVEMGQEVCVLEAMKMKNSIRAPRAGEIGRITVKEGEHVQHHDLLFEYVG
jgi:biotin carboxyl carrier protein